MRERELLLENLIGRSKIDSIQAGIRPSEGGVISGAMNEKMEGWLDQRFGEFGVKILGASMGAEKLDGQEITAIGGWCAIRTADLIQMQQGIVVDPQTGTATKYKDPGMVAEWISRAASIDQVVEAIGIYNGKNYAAISEEKLWGNRVKSTIRAQLRRKLSDTEGAKLDDAIQEAELKRYEYTKRYIKYVTGQDANVARVVDRDIYIDLIMVRDKMLDIAGISMSELLGRYPEEKTLQGYSIVWGMYTGPYLALLKSKGYVQTEKGMIVEPWMHAVSETRAKRLVNEQIFGENRNAYLQPGANQDLGYVAYADVMTQNGQRVRQTTPISGAPNRENYQGFIQALWDNPNCESLDLVNNSAFIWGANLLPFGRTKDILYSMIKLKDAYKKLKGDANAEAGSREEASGKVAELKNTFRQQMQVQAQQVIVELGKMLEYVFDGKGESYAA